MTGEPFETYIDKEILRPLGMTSHSYFVTDAGLTEAPFDFGRDPETKLTGRNVEAGRTGVKIVAFNTQTTSVKEGERRNTRALDAAVRDWLLSRAVRRP